MKILFLFLVLTTNLFSQYRLMIAVKGDEFVGKSITSNIELLLKKELRSLKEIKLVDSSPDLFLDILVADVGNIDAETSKLIYSVAITYFDNYNGFEYGLNLHRGALLTHLIQKGVSTNLKQTADLIAAQFDAVLPTIK